MKVMLFLRIDKEGSGTYDADNQCDVHG
ncbi:hypothetical protein T190130A13A_40285 [Tenacibaculum sp. 190130A14a]|uniref:Uncharacterized protein n=1 Tax=Tenacibaculum polynesiense TaxID=3137857 RepID=A0ABP1EZF1_9FLAO